MNTIPHVTALTLGAALLLSSCTTWQLGERLRTPYTTYTGLDVERPADGKIYHRPTRGLEVSETCYVLAPEKTYNIIPPLTYDASGLCGKPEEEAAWLAAHGCPLPTPANPSSDHS